MATPGEQAAAEGPQNVCQVEEPQEQPIGRPVVQRDRVKERNRGGYDCDFVHPPPDYFLTDCSVCLQVLREAHLASCCGHNFCKECIERVQKDGKGCPLCNKKGFTLTYNRAHDVALKQLEVYCTHREIGCEWNGRLEMLDKHLNVDPELEKHHEGCAFVELQCWHDGCGQFFQRRLIAKHQSRECPQRPFSCEHCHEYESTYHDVVCNHWPVCECYPVSCPHKCTQNTFQRHILQKHLNEECPLQEVECEFKYAGCETKLPRKDMPEHLKENVGHMLLLARQNQELMAKLLEKDEQIRRVTEESRREMETKIDILANDQQERLDGLKREKDEQIRRMADDSRREREGLQREKDEQIRRMAEENRRELEKAIERLAKDQDMKLDGLERKKDEQLETLVRGQRELGQESDRQIEKLANGYKVGIDSLKREKDEQIRRMAEESQRLAKDQQQTKEDIVTLKREKNEQVERLAGEYQTSTKGIRQKMKAIEEGVVPKAAIVKLEGQVMELQQRSETDHIKVERRIAEIENKSATSVAEVQRRITKLDNNKASTVEVKRYQDRVLTLERGAITKGEREKLTHQMVTKRELEDRIGGLEQKQNQELSAKFSHLQIIPVNVTAPVQITFTDFEQHKRDKDKWFSEGFYTHPQGYKMCLCVYANGSGGGKGTHVSCFIYLMRGEFDNHLKWPFRGNVTFHLLDQREDNKHRTSTAAFNDKVPDVYTTRVTSGEISASGWGWPTFTPHSDLGYTTATNCQYLMNDCLYFRVKVELL